MTQTTTTTTQPAAVGAVLILNGAEAVREGAERMTTLDRGAAATFLREYRAAGGAPRKIAAGIYDVPGVDYNGGTAYSGPAMLTVIPKNVVRLDDLDEGATFRAYGSPVQGMRAGVHYDVVRVELQRHAASGRTWQVYLVAEAGTDSPLLQILNVDMVAVQEVR